MIRYFLSGFLLLASLAIAGCAGFRGREARPIGLADLSPTVTTAPIRPMPSLWRIEGKNGATVYLFGSIHALPQDTIWRTPLLDQIVNTVDNLIIERIPILSVDETIRFFTFIKTTGYSREERDMLIFQLPPAYRARARQLWFAANPDIDGDGWMDALRGTRPWYYFVTTQAAPHIPIKGAGVLPELTVSSYFGVESVLKRDFTAGRVKPILSNYDALAEMARLSDADAVAIIKSRFDTAPQSREELIERLNAELEIRQAWLRGDDNAFLGAYKRREANSPAIKHEILINRRNRRWIPAIERYIDGDSDVLITVGAGHLPGENGVIALLRNQGYSVEKIQGAGATRKPLQNRGNPR